MSMGPLPTDTDQLVFKALQTYDNGEIVRWIDTTAPGGPEPEHPAPVLKLTAKDAATSAAATGTDSGSSTGTVVGVIAIVLAALALGLSLLRPRSRPRAE